MHEKAGSCELLCGFGRTSDMQPTLGTYPMQADDFSFNETVEDVIKRGLRAPSSAGEYHLFLRAKDDRNIWGSWFYTDITVGSV